MSDILENTYPIQYIKPITLKDGTLVQLRPIHADDGVKYKTLSNHVSDKTMHNRFLGVVKINDQLIDRFTKLDYSKEMAIIAEVLDGDEKRIIGVARIAAEQFNSAELAVTIIDAWHGRGLGKLLTENILKIAKDMGYRTITARVFSKNIPMIKILDKYDFVLKEEDDEVLVGRLDFDDEYHCLSLNW